MLLYGLVCIRIIVVFKYASSSQLSFCCILYECAVLRLRDILGIKLASGGMSVRGGGMSGMQIRRGSMIYFSMITQ